MTPITTKSQFLELSNAGLLGNRMPSWPDEATARTDGYHGPVMIRSLIPNSPFMRPDISMDDVAETIKHLASMGARPSDLYLTHMTSTVGRRLNAEVARLAGGLYLMYSTRQTNLRDALAAPDRKQAQNAAAVAILRESGTADDYEDLCYLLDAYPDHAIEMTVYDRPIGSIPNRHFIFWEVRMY